MTNDLARLLSTPLAHAERLKTLHGGVLGAPDDEREWLPVPLVGEAEDQIARVPRAMVVGIIRPRLEETFELIKDRLEAAGLSQEMGRRVVLTGGASQLVGVRELAARVLDRQVRLGRPHPVRGLPETASGPAFASPLGLLAWAAGKAVLARSGARSRSGARRVSPLRQLAAGPGVVPQGTAREMMRTPELIRFCGGGRETRIETIT
ncbi:cell division FtsA domain-containing protein [Siccirubricoccus deserti]